MKKTITIPLWATKLISVANCFAGTIFVLAFLLGADWSSPGAKLAVLPVLLLLAVSISNLLPAHGETPPALKAMLRAQPTLGPPTCKAFYTELLGCSPQYRPKLVRIAPALGLLSFDVTRLSTSL